MSYFIDNPYSRRFELTARDYEARKWDLAAAHEGFRIAQRQLAEALRSGHPERIAEARTELRIRRSDVVTANGVVHASKVRHMESISLLLHAA